MIDLALPNAELLERYRDIVPDWDAFIDALSRPLPLCIWTNTLRTTPRRLQDRLIKEGVNVRPVGWNPEAFRGDPTHEVGRSLAYLAGLGHIQEEAALLPVQLLNPQPGERVLDLCAAPGNKTAQIAVAMKNTGTVVANDRNAMRARAARGNLDRLGIVNAVVTIEDAANYPRESGLFDRVLADVPCTCEGTSRKHVAAWVTAGAETSMRMHGRQVGMLRKAVQLCRRGGRVVYATCTYAPEENEMVVDAILREGGVRLSSARIDGFDCSPGLTEWHGRSFDPSLQLTMRVWPHQNDTGGFFVAVLEKEDAGWESAEYASSWGQTDHARGSAAADSASGSAAADSVSGSAHTDPTTSTADTAPGGIPTVEGGKWFELLNDRFGFPAGTFDGYRLVRSSGKKISITPREQQIPRAPMAESAGLPLIRSQLRFPKLTTAGAMAFGPAATRNVLDVTSDQLPSYLSRKDFFPTPTQLEGVTSKGYVLVRTDEIVVGVGLLIEDDDGWRVRSTYPKVLAGRATPDEI